MRRRMTEEEVILWSRLRHLPWKFRRQEPIDRYVVDFVCYSHRIVVEVDGSQHDDSDADRVRDARLGELGFWVMRFSNWDVRRDLRAVIDGIVGAIEARPDRHPSRRPRERFR